MTQVEFYIMEDERPRAAFRHSVALIQKAFQSNRKVFIHTESKRDAEAMDEILWTQDPSSFLPHTLHGDAPGINAPIEIGYGELPSLRPDILINLTSEVPHFHGQFERLIEFVCGDEERKEKARERFKFYRDRGYPLQHYKVES
ncbi:DNA polymerase III subunit chi [Pleionea litopenaei]|uniref:DNA polymerase III subunit chi n=1 Tax=Pleionea litopenaei TaxID=3070815 RepID=A0AA51RVL7_9GAMM|nr:DNA polymerase III subunit chi [Pleionea sp. HL-JVS1]WMS88427.1 DNA polymerase III subunit chi [Pleionea sp. HL-JVS1]